MRECRWTLDRFMCQRLILFPALLLYRYINVHELCAWQKHEPFESSNRCWIVDPDIIKRHFRRMWIFFLFFFWLFICIFRFFVLPYIDVMKWRAMRHLNTALTPFQMKLQNWIAIRWNCYFGKKKLAGKLCWSWGPRWMLFKYQNHLEYEQMSIDVII